MRKKHFTSLADWLIHLFATTPFTDYQRRRIITVMTQFCREQNSEFKADRFIDRVNGRRPEYAISYLGPERAKQPNGLYAAYSAIKITQLS
jgi:hypothetical protein